MRKFYCLLGLFSGLLMLLLVSCSAGPGTETPEEKIILELLIEPQSRDELIQQSGLSVSEANTIISILEIKGLISESMGEIHRN